MCQWCWLVVRRSTHSAVLGLCHYNLHYTYVSVYSGEWLSGQQCVLVANYSHSCCHYDRLSWVSLYEDWNETDPSQCALQSRLVNLVCPTLTGHTQHSKCKVPISPLSPFPFQSPLTCDITLTTVTHYSYQYGTVVLVCHTISLRAVAVPRGHYCSDDNVSNVLCM